MGDLKTLIELLESHDWYYNYSDDLRSVHAGMGKEKDILDLIGGLSKEQANALIDLYVPKEIKPDFLAKVLKTNTDMLYNKGESIE